MGFNTNISKQGHQALQGAYADINNWHDKYQGRELQALDRGLGLDSDAAHQGALARGLSGLSSQMRPNVVNAGALPNLRAGAASMTTGSAGALGGAAADSILNQKQRYSQALKSVVGAGMRSRRLADGSNESSLALQAQKEANDAAYKLDRRQTYAQFGGQVIGLGASYLSTPNAKLVQGAQGALASSLTNANTPGYAAMFNTTPQAMQQAAFEKYLSTPTSNAAYWGGRAKAGWNNFSNWLKGDN